jgi:dipicolinate synthase subunit A
LIAGSISQEITEMIEDNNIKIIDVMKNEELVILNTIATAEGAIESAISNTDIILHKSNVLILGFGRVAKTLAVKFTGLSANVTCSARKTQDLAWIKTYGYNALNINTLGKELSKFDIIINTVPHMILGPNELQYVRKDCLLMDVSSKAGGMDEQYIYEIGFHMVWALALPGKVAPKTTAEFIKNTIYEILKEEN